MKGKLALASNLQLPIGAVTETVAIVGIRGSGKTNTGVVFTEELLDARQQVVIIDPTDVWWGLKSSDDGRKEGYPVVVLGGKHADLALAAGDGATIADFVVDHGVSVVCSLRGFESRADERRFVTDLTRRLYHRKGQEDAPRPLHVIIDEASRYVPQRVMGEDAKMVGAIQQLVRQGRSSGFGVTLIDQRPATINKDVLTQLELLIAHRITSPQDRKALVAWVEQHDTEGSGESFLADLASLPQGTAWFWSPGWLDVFKRVDVRKRRTFDSSRTPKAGERAIAPTAVAKVDLDAMKAKLGASIERARAEDPKELQKRIRELEAELKKKHAGGADRAEVERQVAAAVEKARTGWSRDARRVFERDLSRLGKSIEHAHLLMEKALDAVTETVTPSFLALAGTVDSPPAAAAPAPKASPERTRVSAPRPQREAAPTTRAEGSLARGEQKILDAIAELNAIGIDPPSKLQVSVVASLNLTGGSGSQYVARLNGQGLVEVPAPGRLALTAAGRRHATPIVAPITNEAIQERAMGRLGAGERRILEHLITIYPESQSRAEVGAAVGLNLTGGSGSQYVAKLSTLEFVEVPRPGQLCAGKVLFPENG